MHVMCARSKGKGEGELWIKLHEGHGTNNGGLMETKFLKVLSSGGLSKHCLYNMTGEPMEKD